MLSRKALQITPSPTLSIDAKAKQLKNEGKDVIGFGAGEPDFDTPVHIKEAAINAINQGFTKYTPASGIPELKEAVCARFLRDNGLTYQPQQIVVSNGAKHSLDNVFSALLNQGDEVILPAPYWVSYPELVKLNEGIPVVIETQKEHNYKLKGTQLEKALSPRTKALVLNSPSNPTGQLYSREELEEIASVAIKNNIFIVSDEVYEKLIYGRSEHISIASLGEEIKKLTIIVNGASKTYAMTGWRIGYTASELNIATAMADIQSHNASNPNSIAQKAAYTALTGPQDCVQEMRLTFEKRRDYMLEYISHMPYLTCIEPQGAFYLFVNIGKTFSRKFRNIHIENGDHFAELLLDHYRVALVPGRGFGAPEYARLSYATSMDNIQAGLERLNSFLKELD
ncbi:MAG: pyridoxal phosphate-dependent aminotransferase [Dethiobacter sp.]|jgi:aspartate aminotransferase|nr:MAG: pyridoxal phosphate-dependent aminotransferase [Dethiobacter sp.]